MDEVVVGKFKCEGKRCKVCDSHFYTEGHLGIKDLSVMIIDITSVNNRTERESFWIEKLCTYIPTGLNIREEN